MGWERALDEEDFQLYARNAPLLVDKVSDRLRAPERCDPLILAAIGRVPRHLFVARGYASPAYTDNALPTASGLTTSAPSVIAEMIHRSGVRDGDRLLEIGTGTGYEAAVLAEMGVKVFTIEIDSSLAHLANRLLVRLGYKLDRSLRGARAAEGARRYREIKAEFPRRGEIDLFCGNGENGLPDRAPFRAIIVAASVPNLRRLRPLSEQLAPDGGRLVAPVGGQDGQLLYLVERRGNRLSVSRLENPTFAFVRMIFKERDDRPA